MTAAVVASAFDYLSEGHKVNFNGTTKVITIPLGVDTINVEQDLYSDSKEWLQLRENTKFDPPLRTVGGDPTIGADALGASFFTINGWVIKIDHSVTFEGNLFSDDFDSPFITDSGSFIAQSKFSNLVDKAAVEPDQIGPAVWGAQQTTYNTANTMGAAQNAAASALPVVAATVSGFAVNGVALSSAQGTMLTEVFKLLGLDSGDVLVNTPTRRYTQSSSIVQTITGDPDTSITVTRT